jgi:uncharacterized protein (DUF2267 family)
MAVAGGHRESSRARPHAVRENDRTAYDALVRAVANDGGFAPETAATYIVAVIATLEARLSFTDVAGLEAELPTTLREVLHREPIFDVPGMDEKELFARVRTRLRVPREEAERITRVVLRALRASISAHEAEVIEADLTPGLKTLWRD